MLSVEGFGRRLLRLARRLLASFRIQELELKARLGLDDPADTGRLWAVVGPLSALVAGSGIARIEVEPDFTSALLTFDGRGRIRLVPLRPLSLVLVFLLSPNTIRALHAMRRQAR